MMNLICGDNYQVQARVVKTCPAQKILISRQRQKSVVYILFDYPTLLWRRAFRSNNNAVGDKPNEIIR